MDAIVLPTSRDIRITLYAVCEEKPALGAYFGFAKTRVDDVLYRLGEQVQFYVREDADDELELFRPGLDPTSSRRCTCSRIRRRSTTRCYLVSDVVAGSELHQPTLIERLAAQLDVDVKGLTLIGKPGRRIQFGCSHRIRHTLAPDNSSLTFATAQELINHWLRVLSFDVQRDWTWDGLADAGFSQSSGTREFTGEAGTEETERSVRSSGEKPPAGSRPQSPIGAPRACCSWTPSSRKRTRASLPPPRTHFRTSSTCRTSLTPTFIPSVAPGAAAREAVERAVQVPVTTVPTQVPKIVGAGYALSPYQRNHEYSETAVRERFLWLEFEKPIEDPNDTYFARVLVYAPNTAAGLSQPQSGGRPAGRPASGDRSRADPGSSPTRTDRTTPASTRCSRCWPKQPTHLRRWSRSHRRDTCCPCLQDCMRSRRSSSASSPTSCGSATPRRSGARRRGASDIRCASAASSTRRRR